MKLFESFARWDQNSQCWKTFQRCFLEGWETFSDRWPRSGMTATWHCLPASAVGAPHQRDRVFIICHANGDGESTSTEHDQKESWVPKHLADASCQRRNENAVGIAIQGGAAGSSTEFSNEGSETGTLEKCSDAIGERCERVAEESLPGKRSIQTQLERMVPNLSEQWATEPEVGRVAD